MNTSRSSGNTFKYPEETWDPLSFLDEKSRKELLDGTQQKMDADSPDLADVVFLETGCVTEAKGSCYVVIGDTKVICSVYGPREIPKRDEFSYKLANLHCEFRNATFSSSYLKRRTGAATNTTSLFQQQQQQQSQYNINESISTIIEEALKPAVLLHKYPKSQIDIYIICLQSDLKRTSNAVISASIIAASMSLIDASIECYDLVSSYTNNLNQLTLSYMQSLHQITSIYYSPNALNQIANVDLYKSYIKDAIENCKKVYSLMKHVITNKYKSEYENNKKKEDMN